MFYAAINSYSSETSVGFANTWGVIGFEKRQQRDEYVSEANDLATQAISASEIRKYDSKPGHVSYYDAGGNMHRYMGSEFGAPCFAIEPTLDEVADAAEEIWPNAQD